MKRKLSVGLSLLVAVAVAGITTWVWESSGSDGPPNIVLIVADDLGPHIGTYGDSTVSTPNLDRLANEGVQFDNAFATQASCSPSRSSIFTGLYPHQTGQKGLVTAGYSMRSGLATMPKTLKDAGYRTGVLGKVHVSPDEALPFDYVRLQVGTPSERLDTHSPTELTAAAREFIEGTNDQPFFLMINLGDTHRPFMRQHDGYPRNPVEAQEANLFAVHGELDSPDLRQDVAGYYNGVQRIDSSIEQLLGLLSETDHEENALVIFTSDHGPPFSRGKTTTYEFGLQVPLLVSWPERIVAGQRRTELVSLIDLLPTVLEAAGEPVSKSLPGLSLLPLLNDRETLWRRYLFAEFNDHNGRPPLAPQRSVRDDRFKLVLNLMPGLTKMGLGVDGDVVRKELADPKWSATKVNSVFELIRNPPRVELYDLERDPIEYVNLAGDPRYRKAKRRLLKALENWRQDTQDPYLRRAKIKRDEQKAGRAFLARRRNRSQDAANQ